MTTNTIVWIVVVAVAAILLIAAIAWVARKKRNQLSFRGQVYQRIFQVFEMERKVVG